MYQKIGDRILVTGTYTRGGFTPQKFHWQRQTYPIAQITLKSDIRDGGVRKRFYSVVSGANVYRLEFNRDSETWLLEEVWCE